jgi:hypothetical protein
MSNKQLIEFQLEDGSILTVEGVGSENKSGRALVSRSEDGVEKAEKSFRDAFNVARKAADLVLTSFQEMHSPNEITLEFGIKFSAKAGIIIAAADTEASFKVGLKWQKSKV